MAVSGQKLRTLRTMQLLLEKTDEDHVLSAQGIMDILERQFGMTTDRKSIYNDIELFQEFGLDVVRQKGSNPGYYIGSRDFELPELKLLVDAVQSSKFITAKKSAELIEKLKKLTNEEHAKQLQRQVYINGRLKTENETIYYSVDDIHSAIYHNRQIKFRYAEWTTSAKQQLKRNGDFYIVSPWALVWDDAYYYLIAFEQAADCIKYFRVDKMRDMAILEEARQGSEQFESFDIAEFAKKTFGMFHGEDKRVTFVCKNKMIGVVIDRFGKDIRIMKEDEEHVRFSAVVTLSPQFYGWLTGVGTDIQIKEPKAVKEEYLKYMQEVLSNY